MTNITTMTDLLTREAACRVAPNYSRGHLSEKTAAAQVLLSMAAFRVLPLLSWPGGPYHGQGVSDEDRRYALFNLAGVLQACLRKRIEGRATPAPTQGDTLSLDDLLKHLLDHPAGHVIAGHEYTARSFAERYTDLLARLPKFPTHSAPSLFIAFVRPILKDLGYTVGDLAAAYFEATAGLVPPADAPAGAGAVFHPGDGSDAPAPGDLPDEASGLN